MIIMITIILAFKAYILIELTYQVFSTLISKVPVRHLELTYQVFSSLIFEVPGT